MHAFWPTIKNEICVCHHLMFIYTRLLIPTINPKKYSQKNTDRMRIGESIERAHKNGMKSNEMKQSTCMRA